MRNFILLFFIVLLYVNVGQAQQDPMFTKYMFNSLSYNPAYAGSHDYLSVRLLYRNQWWAFEGAPESQTFTIHTPFKENVGLGLSVVNDKIGAWGSTTANISYAYRLKFGEGKLSLGLQGGVTNWRAKWEKLKFRDPRELDESYMGTNPQKWLPNFGAGVFYYSKIWYAGFSVPHLINWDYRENVTTLRSAQQYRHYYFSAGAAFPLRGNSLIFKPSLLVKKVELLNSFIKPASTANRVGAPTEFDIDASFLIFEALWIGASFRSSFEGIVGDESSMDSADIWASFILRNGLRIGASYDYTLTKLQQHVDGSFEVMLGYDFNYQLRKVETPRYF